MRFRKFSTWLCFLSMFVLICLNILSNDWRLFIKIRSFCKYDVHIWLIILIFYAALEWNEILVEIWYYLIIMCFWRKNILYILSMKKKLFLILELLLFHIDNKYNEIIKGLSHSLKRVDSRHSEDRWIFKERYLCIDLSILNEFNNNSFIDLFAIDFIYCIWVSNKWFGQCTMCNSFLTFFS